MEKHLHIICLDVPYPVNYGGVYDLFYKLPALQEQQVKIHLHSFDKHRDEQPELNKYCQEVFYYPRKTGHKGLSPHLPYIVTSRYDEDLLHRLLADDHPILMEGVHTTYLVGDERFSNRRKFVRIHNVEHKYYRQLFSYSKNLKQKLYYLFEANRLFNYEKKLAVSAAQLWSVTTKDMDYYRTEFACKNISYLPIFIPFSWSVVPPEGMGSYCLYHGNLEIAENEHAVTWLVKHVFSKLKVPLVIAGKNPSKKMTHLIEGYQHITLVPNPGEAEMQDMICKAHIHVLPSFSHTGIKIKLLNALFNGRHCVVNTAMTDGTSLSSTCHVINSVDEFKERISLLYHQPFTSEEKNFRKEILRREFSNETNAKQIIKRIWGD